MENTATPPSSGTASSGGSPDFRHYVRLLVRRKFLILGVLAVVSLLTTLMTIRQPKIYEAVATLIIDVAAPRFLDSNQVQDVSENSGSSYWGNREYTETQVRVLTSRAVAQRVVEKLGLQHDVSFLGLDKVADEKLRAELTQRADPVSILQKKLTVSQIKQTRIIRIEVEDADPNRAALLANEISEAYIAETLSLKQKITENASTWLEERLETLGRQSKTSDLAIFDFKKDADMLTTSLEDRQSMVSQRLESFNKALTEVRLKIASLRAKVESIQSVQKASAEQTEPGRWAEGLPAASQNLTVDNFKMKLANRREECAEIMGRYLENHPKLIACKERVKSAEDDLLRELNNIVVAAQAELKEAAGTEKNLLALLDGAKAEAFEVNKKQIEFDQLKREADNNQRLHELVLKRLKDIELSGLLRTSNVRILDSARPSFMPVRPRIAYAVIGGIIAGLVCGLGLAVLLEIFDTSITNQSEIEERLGLPFLGFLPTIPREANQPESGVPDKGNDLYIYRSPKSSAAECYRAVRTNLLFMSPDQPFKTMVVTSSRPQEGKSTTVINLGIAMAQSGQRILVIDTDMRRPRLHKAFGVSNEVGVSSLIVGEGKQEAAIKSTEVPNLFLLPCGPIPPNPAELLHTQAFRDLLGVLSEKFDRVILDSPPIGAVADAVVLATQTSGVVLVIKGGVTHREIARRAVRSLRDVNARIFGAVLNDIDLEDSKYGEYYYAYRQYGYYYGEKKDEVAPG